MKILKAEVRSDELDLYGVATVELTEAEIRSLDQDVALRLAERGTTLDEAAILVSKHREYMAALLAMGKMKAGMR